MNELDFVQFIHKKSRIAYMIFSGNLGNHIYLLSAALHLMKNGFEVIFIVHTKNNYKVNNNEFPYLSNFNYTLVTSCVYECILEQNISIINYADNIDDVIHYYKDANNCVLYFNNSYFQDSKYFLMYKEEICNMIFDNSFIIEFYMNKVKDINRTVLISVRKGDYMLYDFFVLKDEYYIDMYDKYFSGYDIFITSDDIDYVKKHFVISMFKDCNNIEFIEDMRPTEILQFASNFKNFICANSSFSSSCELMSDSNDKKVIAVPNISAYYKRMNMFSKDAILIDVTKNEYNKYIV